MLSLLLLLNRALAGLRQKPRLNPYATTDFFGKGNFHVSEAPEKSNNAMEVLRPVLSTSLRGALHAVEKKQLLEKILGQIFG